LIDAAGEIEPRLYRRYLDIMIRGIAADPDREPPLTAPAPELERVDEILFNVNRTRR